jgi:hypothetical protein
MVPTVMMSPPALPTETSTGWDITCLRCLETTVTKFSNLSLALRQHSSHQCA